MLTVALRRAATGPEAPVALPLPEGATPPEPYRAAALAARFTGRAGQVVDCLAPAHALLVGAGPGATTLDWERAGGEAAAHAGEVARALAIDARGLPPEAA